MYGISAACDSTVYDNYFWKNVEAPFVLLNNTWYYSDRNSLRTWSGSGENTAVEFSFMQLYQRLYPGYIWSSDRMYAGYGGLFPWDGKLYLITYYNIVCYDPVLKSDTLVSNPGIGNTYIYGGREKDGTMFYYNHNNESGWELLSMALPTPTRPTPTNTPTPTPRPASYAAPQLLSATPVSNGIKVTWEAVPGVTKYRLYRKEGSQSFKKLIDVTGTSRVNTGVVRGRQYTYTVACLSDDGKTVISPYDTTGISAKR